MLPQRGKLLRVELVHKDLERLLDYALLLLLLLLDLLVDSHHLLA